MLPLYTKMFNIILETGIIPTCWSEGYIIPIYKGKGDFMAPKTILSCLGKLFTAVLNKRLTKFRQHLQEMYVKKHFFVTNVLYNWKSLLKISCTKCMIKKFISGNCYWIWKILPWWPWPLTPKSIGFLCYAGWMCAPSLRKIGEGVLEFLIGNVLAHLTPVTLTFDPKINRIPLLPETDVWTKIEEGRSRLSPVIDRKRFWLIWPQWPWPLTSDAKINRLPLSSTQCVDHVWGRQVKAFSIYWSETVLAHLTPVTLTFNPVTQSL